jgi:hypothetical protein
MCRSTASCGNRGKEQNSAARSLDLHEALDGPEDLAGGERRALWRLGAHHSY